MTRRTTTPSTPRLSDFAKHVRAPSSACSTGWPAVEQKITDLGIKLRLWQRLAGRIILSKDADGLYSAGIGGVGLCIPRQV
ncbi:MAG: terminase, partial [bacterium]|nr:terminase [bacterium]